MSNKLKFLTTFFAICLLSCFFVVGVLAISKIDFSLSGDLIYEAPAVKDVSAYPNLVFNCTTDGEGNNVASVKADYANDPSGELILPEKVIENEVEYTLTAIEDNAFIDPSFQNENLDDAVTLEQMLAITRNYTSPITSIKIPDTVTSVGTGAFAYNESLVSVDMGEGITSISDNLFSACINLKNLQLPSRLTSVGDFAFVYCNDLNEIVLPDSVQTIGENAFSACATLLKVTISQNLVSIAANAFVDSGQLREIYNRSEVEVTAEPYLSIVQSQLELNIYNEENGSRLHTDENGFVFYVHEGLYALVGYLGEEAEIDLPASYLGNNYIIAVAAFTHDDITHINLSSGVTSVESWAFVGCTNLLSIDTGSNLNSLPSYAIIECPKFKKITIGPLLTTINENAFLSISTLTTVVIKNTTIAAALDSQSACSGLISNATEIYVETTNAASLNQWVKTNYPVETAISDPSSEYNGYTRYSKS